MTLMMKVSILCVPNHKILEKGPLKQIPTDTVLQYTIQLLEVGQLIESTEQRPVKTISEGFLQKEVGEQDDLDENKDIINTNEFSLTILNPEDPTGETPKPGARVKVHYTGMFTNGDVFDSSVTKGRKPFEFLVGVGQVIQCWEDALS